MWIPSYRGYWGSTGLPSQRGIERDLAAIFAHLKTEFQGAEIVLWGQSIGCGILMRGLEKFPLENVKGIILETPFVSIEEMLIALYPQRWLPYRYLGWALWNRWELLKALRGILLKGWRGKVLVLKAGSDEVVPDGQAERIAKAAEEGGAAVQAETVDGALHVECMVKPRGRKAVVEFLQQQ
jgi:pimeloyl-ACP methyl ester carboxylesterase